MVVDFKDLRDTYNELVSDYEHSKKLSTDLVPEHFIKRTVIRSYFSLVEGTIFQLKQVALQANEQINKLSNDELSFLKEKVPYITEQGVLKYKNSHISLMTNLLFTANCLIRVFDISYEIKKEHGFNAFKKAIKLRDTVTHPKSKTGIQFSDQEFLVISDANIWYREIFTDLINSIQEKCTVT